MTSTSLNQRLKNYRSLFPTAIHKSTVRLTLLAVNSNQEFLKVFPILAIRFECALKLIPCIATEIDSDYSLGNLEASEGDDTCKQGTR